MKIKSNLPPEPSPSPLGELQHGDVFRLHNNSLQSIIEGSNTAFIRGFADSASADIPATSLTYGNHVNFRPGQKVYKLNATLLIEPEDRIFIES